MLFRSACPDAGEDRAGDPRCARRTGPRSGTREGSEDVVDPIVKEIL